MFRYSFDFRRHFIPDDVMVMLLWKHMRLRVHCGELLDPALHPLEHHGGVETIAGEFWCCDLTASKAMQDYPDYPFVGLKKVPGHPGLFKLWMLVTHPEDRTDREREHSWLELQVCLTFCLWNLRRQHARVILPSSLVGEGEMIDEFTLIERNPVTTTLRWSRAIACAD